MKNNHRGLFNRASVNALALAVAASAACAQVQADEGTFKYDGYLRQELSWNAKNWEDTPNYNDRGKLSMARSTALLNLSWKPSEGLSFFGKFRVARELKTGFLNHLEKNGANNFRDDNGRGDIMDLYNSEEIRELYADIKLNERTWLRVGKQQIAWGETDFFAANDLVHGFDNTWRSFLEPANEELRKTNIMAKLNVDVPEWNGGIEAFVRPGWDRKQDIGTEIDIYGGRWSSQPYASVDFRNIDHYNFDHKDGKRDAITGGIRWNGLWGETNYSLSYLKTYWNSPILNASNNLALIGLPGVPSGAQTTGSNQTRGVAGEIIYPIVDVYGFTASRYSAAADAVFSTEFAYIKAAPYQFEATTPTLLSQFIAPGFDGYKEKDVVALMVRMDKTLAGTQELLGSDKPLFFSVQLFDKWIQNYDAKDQLLYSVGWGGKVKEHSVLGTMIFGTSYNNGRIQPGLVLGADLSNGGGFAVPSVTFELTSNLKLKFEYDHFWDDEYHDTGKCQPGNLAFCENTTLFGYFHNRDQFYTSLTYLF